MWLLLYIVFFFSFRLSVAWVAHFVIPVVVVTVPRLSFGVCCHIYPAFVSMHTNTGSYSITSGLFTIAKRMSSGLTDH